MWLSPTAKMPVATGRPPTTKRRRRFVVAGRPLVTGLFAVGDSHICTNPLYGRGCPLAMVQAYLLADTLAADGTEPEGSALAFHAAVEREVAPWYRATVVRDRLERRTPPPSSPPDDDEPASPLDDDSMRSLLRDGILPAAGTDPVVYRAFLRAFNLLDPPEALTTDPEVVARVLTVWQERDSRPPSEPLGPDREELLRLLAGGAAA